MKRFNLYIAVIFEIALILRVWQAGTAQLWYDESFTLLLARLPFDRMIQATAGDVHPPLWYALQWLLIRVFSESHWVMRAPSVLASMAGLWLAYRLAQQLNVSQPAQLAALGFLALNSTQIWYAQEARQYALFQALVLWSVLAMLNRRWVQLGLAFALLVWLHNYGLIYGLVIGLLALWRERANRAELVKVVLCGAVALVSWLPWAWVLSGQMSDVASAYWIQPTSIGSALFNLSFITWGFALTGPMESVAPLVFMGLVLLTLIRSIQSRSNGVLAWMALAPEGIVLLIEALWIPVLLFRGLIGSVPFLVLWICKNLANTRRQQLILAVLVAPVMLAGQITWAYEPTHKGKESRIIDTILMPLYQPGDILVHVNDGSYVIFTAYSDLPQYELAHDCPDPHGALSAVTREALGVKKISLAEARARGRVLLIGGMGSTSTACEEQFVYQITQGVPSYYKEHTDLKYVGVWLYEVQARKQ